jgi:DNA mismatch repair protein MutH
LIGGEEALLRSARALSGRSVEEVARSLGRELPSNGHKGFVGSLIERALGIAPSSKAGPDAPELGVEIKTTPVDGRGVPRESTFVCMVPREGLDAAWSSSAPRGKLARVLFIPIEASGPLAQRRVGTAFYWSPSAEEERALAEDWDELAGLLSAHGQAHVSARIGRALQVRPKAANRAARWVSRDGDGAPVHALPRAFYLRRTFVATILAGAGLARPQDPAR